MAVAVAGRLVVAVCVLVLQTVLASAASAPLFNTEVEAQSHCPKDVVVWVNLPTGIYHLKGERWFGNTNHGAYVCEQEGEQAGYRATRNGQ